MIEKFFYPGRTLEDGCQWKQFDKALADSQTTPQLIIGCQLDAMRENIIWCSQHHCYEGVDSINEYQVFTQSGCTLVGHIRCVEEEDICFDEEALLVYAWHICQQEPVGELLVTAKIRELKRMKNRWIMYRGHKTYKPLEKETFGAYSIHLKEGTMQCRGPRVWLS